MTNLEHLQQLVANANRSKQELADFLNKMGVSTASRDPYTMDTLVRIAISLIHKAKLLFEEKKDV